MANYSNVKLMLLSVVQSIEIFHLCFLSILQTSVQPRSYVVKGGANLRYFFGSPRYSEDIDLDTIQTERWRLEEHIDAILNGPALLRLLTAQGLNIADWSKPKQTETTQRWKIGLSNRTQTEVRTELEFSRREIEGDFDLLVVPDQFVRRYGIRPPTVQRYDASAMLKQKVLALALRNETQARDVFDLELLFRACPEATPFGGVDEPTRTQAIAAATGLAYATYNTQVVPFLESDVVEIYASEDSWNRAQEYVIGRLEQVS